MSLKSKISILVLSCIALIPGCIVGNVIESRKLNGFLSRNCKKPTNGQKYRNDYYDKVVNAGLVARYILKKQNIRKKIPDYIVDAVNDLIKYKSFSPRYVLAFKDAELKAQFNIQNCRFTIQADEGYYSGKGQFIRIIAFPDR